uniref:Uncharacterized protein n=1 Tax=Corethron hystrix TaxID=216773 RepID=A0A7S1C0S4_9STRA|mmetsp:Transcript_7730/g.16778  ORF Transcript_7730/g.16778 Transcript_7730/m.16778 type:complete len:634 (+) Transcript_7730:49-1950(+)
MVVDVKGRRRITLIHQRSNGVETTNQLSKAETFDELSRAIYSCNAISKDDDDDHVIGAEDLIDVLDKRSATYDIIDEINAAESFGEIRRAIRCACELFSHKDVDLHDFEVEKGAATALYKQLFFVCLKKNWMYELCRSIVQAISLVYLCSLPKIVESVRDIGEELITSLFQVLKHAEDSPTIEYAARTFRLLSQSDSSLVIILNHLEFSDIFVRLLKLNGNEKAKVEVMRTIARLTSNEGIVKRLTRLHNYPTLLESVIILAARRDNSDDLWKWAETTLSNLMRLSDKMPLLAVAPLLDTLIEFTKENDSIFRTIFVATALQQLTQESENQVVIASFADGKFIKILIDMIDSDGIDLDTQLSAMTSLKNIVSSGRAHLVMDGCLGVSIILTGICLEDGNMALKRGALNVLKEIMNCGIDDEVHYYKEILTCINALLRSQNAALRDAALESLKRQCEIIDNQYRIIRYPGQLDALAEILLNDTSYELQGSIIDEFDTYDREGSMDLIQKFVTWVKKQDRDRLCHHEDINGSEIFDRRDAQEGIAVLNIIWNLVSHVDNCEIIAKNTILLTALSHVLPHNNDGLNGEDFRDLCHHNGSNICYQIIMMIASDPKSLEYILKHNGLMDRFFNDFSTI